MDYASIYFGKSLGQLEYKDIEEYFSTDREETDQLEFKSFGEKENFDSQLSNIVAGISAFLNSSGGVLIWGAPTGEKPAGKKEKVYKGPLSPLNRVLEKDWLISRVSDKIIPLPSGVRVQLLEKDGDQVCVFEIDESLTSPHQHDGKYYMRIDGQKKPAPHHYVEALFKKISFPQIEAFIKPTSKYSTQNSHTVNIELWFINFTPYENEEEFTFKITVSGGVFAKAKSYMTNTLMPGFSQGGTRYSNEQNKFTLYHGEDDLEDASIEISRDELVAKNDVVDLYVSFGGKKSPLRISHYKIDFSNADNLRHGDVTDLFKIEFENKLWADINREFGRTKEHIIKSKGFFR